MEQGDEDAVVRINGYLHALSALEDRLESEWVLVTIRFVDQDPAKLESLSLLIAAAG